LTEPQHGPPVKVGNPPEGTPPGATADFGAVVRLATCALVVGGVALTMAKVVGSQLDPSRGPARLAIIGVVAIMLTVVAGLLTNSVRGRLRRGVDRYGQQEPS